MGEILKQVQDDMLGKFQIFLIRIMGLDKLFLLNYTILEKLILLKGDYQMIICKTHAKGQIILPKKIRKQLGIEPGKALAVKLVDDHVEIRALPDDPIEFLTGIFEGHRRSMVG